MTLSNSPFNVFAALAILLLAQTALANSGSLADLGATPNSSATPIEQPDYPDFWHRRFVDEPVMGSRLHVITAGDRHKPALVLVHGLGQSGVMDWREVIDELANDFHILALDLPGFGQSSLPQERLSPENYAAVIHWLIKREGLDKVHLVGHSMGGAVVLFYGARYPELLEHLTLVDAAGILHRAAFVKSMATVERSGFSFLPPALERKAVQVLNFSDKLIEEINLLPDFTQLLRRSDMAWNALLSDQPNTNAALSLINTDFSHLIDAVRTPTSIIWGERDPIAPVRTAYLLQSQIPRSRLTVIPGAEHVPLKSHSVYVAQLLRNRSGELSPAPIAAAGHGDLHCKGLTGARYSGRYRRVILDGCLDVSLVDLRAESVELRNSTAEFIRLDVRSHDRALRLERSTATLTGARLSGKVAVELNGSRIDLAGAYLYGEQVGIKVDARSVVIASVSEVHSPRYRGKLHGLARAANAAAEVLPQLQSAASAYR